MCLLYFSVRLKPPTIRLETGDKDKYTITQLTNAIYDWKVQMVATPSRITSSSGESRKNKLSRSKK